VATTDGALADTLRIARDYGNPGDYDTRFPGLNARMSELHATVALASFARLDEHVARRTRLVDRFEAALAGVSGVRLVRPDGGDTSTFKDLTMVVDPDLFGIDAGALQLALGAEGIDSRRYYHPPIHRQKAYADRWATPRELNVTDTLAGSVLSPPLWSHMTDEMIDRIAWAVGNVHQHARQIVSAR
jgi:dTDP-4-amino-4,6-dideoxygalactose transaminase